MAEKNGEKRQSLRRLTSQWARAQVSAILKNCRRVAYPDRASRQRVSDERWLLNEAEVFYARIKRIHP